ncbi:MAG TPA: proline racemase family protein [Beijerinckiaceae bacterium]|nr:proline racemase family protein [Beijerinckiaceae bacterium]
MKVIDSHTAGEPTRLIVAGGPDLGRGTMAERRARFQRDFDHIRSFVVNEPRGYDALVGGLICEPVDPTAAAGIIFFNNVGMIGMCGHGTIGLAVTLAHLGRIGPGRHRIETPVGEVAFELIDAHQVRITNVASYRHAKGIAVKVPGLGRVVGDVAWGGNWFFLTETVPCPIKAAHLGELTAAATAIQQALDAQGIRGADGGRIDHVEMFGPPGAPGAHSRSFVLCPGGAYDRSPCGTGTSAKLACLAADDKLAPGTTWVQESVIGSRFEASYQPGSGGTIIPSITGRAYITGEAILLRDPADPFGDGIRF